MSIDTTFTSRSLTASEYVRELFKPGDNTAILVRNRSNRQDGPADHKGRNHRRDPEFQAWLASPHARWFRRLDVGMNPIKEGAYTRTKDNIKDIRHVYLDLDRKADEALEAIRNSTEFQRRTLCSIPRPASTKSSGKWVGSIRTG